MKIKEGDEISGWNRKFTEMRITRRSHDAQAKDYSDSIRQSSRAEKDVCCTKSGRHTARICEP